MMGWSEGETNRMGGLKRINPAELNSRQKENYNYQKISALLADYGFMTMRLSDDWQGADFIAQHIDGETFLKIQLKSRLMFDKKYRQKGIYVAFPCNSDWYLYPHDEMLQMVLSETGIGKTKSWNDGSYHFPKMSKKLMALLEKYKIGSIAESPSSTPL
jgi:hypothetical protein